MASDLETHLGYWLRFVSNHVSHAFSLKLQARDVTVAEWVVLRDLFDGDGVPPSLLADRNDAEFFGHLKPAERAALEKTLKDIVRRHGLKTIPTR